jgi:O-antigen/teichoic acid export membrane protein
VVAVIANGCLNFLLVPRFGIMGAAFATLGAFFGQLVFSTLMATRSGPFWNSYGGLYRISAAAAIMALAIRLFDRSMQLSDSDRLIVFIPLGAALYAGLAFAFGVIPRPYLKTALSWLAVQRGPTT